MVTKSPSTFSPKHSQRWLIHMQPSRLNTNEKKNPATVQIPEQAVHPGRLTCRATITISTDFSTAQHSRTAHSGRSANHSKQRHVHEPACPDRHKRLDGANSLLSYVGDDQQGYLTKKLLQPVVTSSWLQLQMLGEKNHTVYCLFTFWA